MFSITNILLGLLYSTLSITGLTSVIKYTINKFYKDNIFNQDILLTSIIVITLISTALSITQWESNPPIKTIELFFRIFQALMVLCGALTIQKNFKTLITNKRVQIVLIILFIFFLPVIFLQTQLNPLHDWDAFSFWYPKLITASTKGYFHAKDGISHSNYISGIIQFLGYHTPYFLNSYEKIILSRFLMLAISVLVLDKTIKFFNGVYYWILLFFFISGQPEKFLTGDQDIILALLVLLISSSLLTSKQNFEKALFSKKVILTLFVLPLIKNEGFLYLAVYLVFASYRVIKFQGFYKLLKLLLKKEHYFLSILMIIPIWKVFFIDYSDLASRNSTYLFSTVSVFMHRLYFILFRIIVYMYKFYPGYYWGLLLSSVGLLLNRKSLNKVHFFLISWSLISLFSILIILCLSNTDINFQVSTTLHRVTIPPIFILILTISHVFFKNLTEKPTYQRQ